MPAPHSTPPPDDLETFIHQTLRSVPAHRAPRSLESRVLAAIARRQALPWWRQSFSHWPLAARVVFLVVSATLAALVILAGVDLMRGVELAAADAQPLQSTLGRLASLRATLSALTETAGHLLGRIPAFWLYASLAAVGALYATLFGLGAAAYRMLWQSR